MREDRSIETEVLQRAVPEDAERARLKSSLSRFQYRPSRRKGIPLCIRFSRFLFIHIPKTGGMSVAQAVYGRQVWHRTALAFLERNPEFFHKRTSFSVVRNPWDRAVSAYEFSCAGGSPKATLADVPPAPMLKSFEIFTLDYLFANKDRLLDLDGIFRPQHVYVNDRDGRCLVNFLGRFEAMEELETRLTDLGAIKKPLRHLNRSSSRAARDYRRYYQTPRLVDAIAEIYARDVSQFSYQFG